MKTLIATMVPGHVVLGFNTTQLHPRDVARAWRRAGKPLTGYVAGNPRGARKLKGYHAPQLFPTPTGHFRDVTDWSVP